MEINGKTRVCGLIGNPVEHSVSPAIHNTLAQMTGFDLAYTTFHVEKGRLCDAVKGAFALNLLGMNVTVPYKSDVLEFINDIDPLAKKIGAVNTLVRNETGYKGYNTDMPGLLRAMQHDGVRIEGEQIILLGAGGVSRAIAMMLAENGAEHIYILNRTLDKAKNIADEVNGYSLKQIITPMEISDYEKLYETYQNTGRKYLAIQATSVGMHPNIDDCVITDSKFYDMIHTGYDSIFNPLETKFMKLAKQKGAKAYHGLRMLLYQGIIAFELWTGKKVSEEDAEIVYTQMLKAMGID